MARKNNSRRQTLALVGLPSALSDWIDRETGGVVGLEKAGDTHTHREREGARITKTEKKLEETETNREMCYQSNNNYFL